MRPTVFETTTVTAVAKSRRGCDTQSYILLSIFDAGDTELGASSMTIGHHSTIG